MGRRLGRPGNPEEPAPSPRPLPNLGRGAFYGLAGTIVGAFFWAFYVCLFGEYELLMPAAAGWFASTCVKRGVGSVDSTGVALSVYFTLMIVILGELFTFGWLSFSDTGRFTLAGPFVTLAGYFRANPKDLFFTLLFTGLGIVVAVFNCREGIRRKKKS